MEKLLTSGQVARRLSCVINTLRAIPYEDLPFSRTPKGHRRYNGADVEKYAARQAEPRIAICEEKTACEDSYMIVDSLKFKLNADNVSLCVKDDRNGSTAVLRLNQQNKFYLVQSTFPRGGKRYYEMLYIAEVNKERLYGWVKSTDGGVCIGDLA